MAQELWWYLKAMLDLSHMAWRSITFDLGTEFVSWPLLQAEIGTQIWFWDPSSPWQKGTIENTTRRIRKSPVAAVKNLPRARAVTGLRETFLAVESSHPAREGHLVQVPKGVHDSVDRFVNCRIRDLASFSWQLPKPAIYRGTLARRTCRHS